MTTRIAPRISAQVRLSIDSSIKVAGRKISMRRSRCPGRPGWRSWSASSTPRVTSSVFAHGSFSTISIRPGPPLMTASPMSGWWSTRTSANSRQGDRSAAPGPCDRDLPERLRGHDGWHVTDPESLVRGVDEAARCQSAAPSDQEMRVPMSSEFAVPSRTSSRVMPSCLHPLGLDLNLQLVQALTPDRDIGDAGNAQAGTLSDLPVRHDGKVDQRHLIRREPDLHRRGSSMRAAGL